MSRDTSFRATGLRIGGGETAPVTRALPEEVPVALSYEGSTQAVMMATPSDLEDFAVGFSLTEGIVATADEIAELHVQDHETGIEVQMWLAGDRGAELSRRRRAMAGPVGCGLCGIDSLDQAMRPLPRVTARPFLDTDLIIGATDALRALQPLHDETRAVHAAGFLTPDGLHFAREDVGRHNALDKVIGALARSGTEAAQGAFVMTSRVSIELVQKCALAGCGMLIAVSAPTARALRLAEEAGITLVALSRNGQAEVFTHPDRVTGEPHVA